MNIAALKSEVVQTDMNENEFSVQLQKKYVN